MSGTVTLCGQPFAVAPVIDALRERESVMAAYSIEKKGADFVVRADQQDILKFATRRQAAQMIREARACDGAATRVLKSAPVEAVANG